MHTYLVLMSLALSSLYSLFSLQAGPSSCPLSLAQAGCQGESFFFLLEGSEHFPAYLSGTAPLQNTTCSKPATSNTPPPTPCTPPPSCCAPIKAELIKPQLIASAGGGMRREKGGRERGIQLYIGIYLPFSTYSARLAVAFQCICLMLTRHPHPRRCSSAPLDGEPRF